MNSLEFSQFKLSGIYNPGIADKFAAVRSRPVSWDGFIESGLITNDEVKLLQKFSANKPDYLGISLDEEEEAVDSITISTKAYLDLICTSGESYIELLFSLLNKIIRVETVRYLLILLDEALQATASSRDLLSVIQQKYKPKLYSTILKCLQKDDEIIQLASVKILGELISQWNDIPDAPLNGFLGFLLRNLKNSSKNWTDLMDICMQCLIVMLRKPDLRKKIYYKARSPKNIGDENSTANQPENDSSKLIEAGDGSVSSLLSILLGLLSVKSRSAVVGGEFSGNPQIQYHVMSCIWLWSFDPQISSDLHASFYVLPKIYNVLRDSEKEKVTRVCLATLRNFLTTSRDTYILPIVGIKIPELIETLKTRKWSDDGEIKDDLNWLHSTLRMIIEELSTWDEYLSELKSGMLVWSPPHTNEWFWKNHSMKFTENDGEVIKMLANILETSSDSETIAIACHDLAKILKHSQSLNCKKFISESGAKTRVMIMMTHESEEVRYNALLATQAYMVNALE